MCGFVCMRACVRCVCVRVVCVLSLSRSSALIYIYIYIENVIGARDEIFFAIETLVAIYNQDDCAYEVSAPRRVYTRTNEEEQCWRGKCHTAKVIAATLAAAGQRRVSFLF